MVAEWNPTDWEPMSFHLQTGTPLGIPSANGTLVPIGWGIPQPFKEAIPMEHVIATLGTHKGLPIQKKFQTNHTFFPHLGGCCNVRRIAAFKLGLANCVLPGSFFRGGEGGGLVVPVGVDPPGFPDGNPRPPQMGIWGKDPVVVVGSSRWRRPPRLLPDVVGRQLSRWGLPDVVGLGPLQPVVIGLLPDWLGSLADVVGRPRPGISTGVVGRPCPGISADVVGRYPGCVPPSRC